MPSYNTIRRTLESVADGVELQTSLQRFLHENYGGMVSILVTLDATSAVQLLEWAQQYWGIEIGLHYRRDVTLAEDATRMTDKKRAEIMSILNNFIILEFRAAARHQRL